MRGIVIEAYTLLLVLRFGVTVRAHVGCAATDVLNLEVKTAPGVSARHIHDITVVAPSRRKVRYAHTGRGHRGRPGEGGSEAMEECLVIHSHITCAPTLAAVAARLVLVSRPLQRRQRRLVHIIAVIAIITIIAAVDNAVATPGPSLIRPIGTNNTNTMIVIATTPCVRNTVRRALLRAPALGMDEPSIVSSGNGGVLRSCRSVISSKGVEGRQVREMREVRETQITSITITTTTTTVTRFAAPGALALSGVRGVSIRSISIAAIIFVHRKTERFHFYIRFDALMTATAGNTQVLSPPRSSFDYPRPSFSLLAVLAAAGPPPSLLIPARGQDEGVLPDFIKLLSFRHQEGHELKPTEILFMCTY